MEKVSRCMEYRKTTNTSVKPVIKRLVKCNTMNRQKEAGHPQTATTP